LIVSLEVTDVYEPGGKTKERPVRRRNVTNL